MRPGTVQQGDLRIHLFVEDQESFAIAMDLADEPDPRKCVMIDDLPRTTRAALDVGMASLLYGYDEATEDASGAFTDWTTLPILLRE